MKRLLIIKPKETEVFYVDAPVGDKFYAVDMDELTLNIANEFDTFFGQAYLTGLPIFRVPKRPPHITDPA